MKPINMTKEAKVKLFEEFTKKFMKELDDFEFNMNDNKMSFSFDVSQQAKEKVTIMYTQQAYLRMMALVDYYDTEVGWYGLVEQLSDKLYLVYDVKLCKQYVNGAKVDTEDEDTLEFFNSLTDDEAEHLHFQAHSHVRMSTSASSIDLRNQADVVKNMGKSGFYIFQIWNKNLDISTYLYDLDNNVFYDKKDIIIEIDDETGSISDFINNSIDLVIEKKSYQYKSKEEKKEEPKNTKHLDDYKKTEYLNGYWDGVTYPERWEW